MKNTLILILFAFPFYTVGQSNSIQDFYAKYKDHHDIIALTLSGGILNFAASFEEDGNSRLLEKITQVRLLVMEEGNLVIRKDYDSLMKGLKEDAFDELMKIKEQATNINIFIREKEDSITDVVLIVQEEEGFVLINLEGNFKFSDLNDLDLNFDGGEYLKKIPENRKSIPRA